ncbi:sigma-70 family RNA polymerase sigma factor [Nonomuraea sp. NPDC050556]|uniref:sigma-70 family RNA polymerase sigma factor n=1 Tax=Nonomuraea sp. NPDC050556 TaxID=3364369 RepID=UPI0037B9AD7E
MIDHDWLAEQFEGQRGHLRAVAYRMLGSLSEAEDAVQEAWFRLSRSYTDEIENLGGWLTTVVGRVSLDMLRARKSRHEEDIHVPDPIVSAESGADPEHEAMLTDSVGLAMLVVLDTLAPAERLAFVLHDMFAVPFEDIAPIVDRSAPATRQLASRARRRVQDAAPQPDPDVTRQRQVVNAFLAASRDGDFEALVAVLDPDVLLRADGGEARPSWSKLLRGAQVVASNALMFSKIAAASVPVLVNGEAAVLGVAKDTVFSVMVFHVVDGRIVEINVVTDPDRLTDIDVAALRA